VLRYQGSKGIESLTEKTVGFNRLFFMDQMLLLENRLTLRAISEFGGYLLYFYICDRTDLLGESAKNYSRDLFLFLYFLLIIVSAMTSFKVHQDKSALTGKSILYLNRHQTEEWKGWMQVLIILIFFLLWSFLVPQERFLLILFPRNIVG